MARHHVKYTMILILFILAFISSIIIAFVPLPTICQPGQGCGTVQNSPYAKTFGIDNSFYGIVIFGVMCFATYSQLRKPKRYKKLFLDAGIFIGSMISLYFIYLQIFVIQAFCKYCLVVDFSMLILLIIALIPWEKKSSNKEQRQ